MDRIVTVSSNDLVDNIRRLYDQGFRVLIDIFGVDYPGRSKRIEVSYLLLDIRANARVVLKVDVGLGGELPSVTKIFSAAAWLEREVYDMNGVIFKEHPDLRRILTNYNFKDHPLLKDFPLSGHTEVRFDQFCQKVVEEPLNLSQAYRHFDFSTVWEGPKMTMEAQLTSSSEEEPAEDS